VAGLAGAMLQVRNNNRLFFKIQSHIECLQITNDAVVLVGVAQHNEVRTLDEEIGLSLTLWCIFFGLVHLFTNRGTCCITNQSIVALQIIIR
jgi:hypothetical protein